MTGPQRGPCAAQAGMHHSQVRSMHHDLVRVARTAAGHAVSHPFGDDICRCTRTITLNMTVVHGMSFCCWLEWLGLIKVAARPCCM